MLWAILNKNRHCRVGRIQNRVRNGTLVHALASQDILLDKALQILVQSLAGRCNLEVLGIASAVSVPLRLRERKETPLVGNLEAEQPGDLD